MPSMFKLLLAIFMGGLTIFLISLVLTFQVVLVQKRTELAQQQQGGATAITQPQEAASYSKNLLETIVPTEEMRDLQLWRNSPDRSYKSVAASAQAYWNQVLPYLKQWDAVVDDDDDVDSTSHLPQPTPHLWESLQEAARLGHAEAQYFVANALTSGILPFSLASNLTVPVDMLPHDNDDPAVLQSYLYYHMAAMDGHVPSAVTLAVRHKDEESCHAMLPYYQEAALGIMDSLEHNKHSRAKVTPPMDAHVLSEIFLKGAASQLHWTNQPDEHADALRYYHMRASHDDVHAAYTLAHLYHYGLRGVTQNLTMALQYYDMSAKLGHWESAGQAGKFHLFGMGMEFSERNLVKAQKYLKQGAPHGIDGCRKRFRNAQIQKQKRQASENDDQCDHPAVNGLGLLYLWGMPLLLDRNLEKAQKFFELARDMGNMDASYNLAMMRLGWKTHWKSMDELEGDDDDEMQSSTVPHFLKSGNTASHGPSKADYLVALQELVSAANKGHLQARHRLGLLYSHGVRGPEGNVIIQKDCNKALKHFQWIAETANPHLSHHTRRAYKYYTAGNSQAALRNYLAAAEMGHQVSQVNAAFLLEQGVCLSLTETQCAAASLRLWKAAVKNNPEASLRVGDMYYYGRLRKSLPVGPFSWLPYVLYPERHVLPIVRHGVERLVDYAKGEQSTAEEPPGTSVETTCEAGQDGTCLAIPVEKDVVESDLEMAAKYYRLAAEMHKSARANFNLGFLYEWGLGVKQDFPLAKRHYDLAKVTHTGEADLAVNVALMAMKFHEHIVKLYMSYQEWRERNSPAGGESSAPEDEQIPMSAEGGDVGHPVPPMAGDNEPRTVTDVIISHLLSWESLLIVLLTILLSKLLQHRRTP